MEDAVIQVKNAVISGRTDIVNTVLENCAKFGHGGVSLREKILLDHNIVPEGTFLHLGTKLGLVDVVRTFLMAGADPTIENKQGENAYELVQSEQMQQVYIEELLRAVANSDFERMDQLFKAGLDPNSWDCEEKKNSVLHWAVSFSNPATVSYLLDRGADVNAETSEGVTALHDAVDRGIPEIIGILLEAGASPLIKAEKGKYADQSPLDLASSKPDIFSQLSHFLAEQFKRKTKRSSSMESVSLFNGPESPVFAKDGHSMFRSPHLEMGSTSGSGEYMPVYSGFNSALESVLRNLELQAPVQPIVTDSNLSLLWPQPKSLRQLDGLHFRPEKFLYISVVKSRESVHRILDVVGTYKGELDKLGFDATAKQVDGGFDASSNFIHSSLIQCCVNSDVLPVPNSYRIHVSSQKIRITAADLPGFHYAICTLIQLLTLYTKESEPTGIPPLIINDHPSLQHRAVFIDISQERVPTIPSLCELIQSLSLLKINYLHLHLRLDKNGFLLSYTKGEIVAIDRQCEDYGLVLVPAIDIPCVVTSPEFMTYIKPMLQDLLPCFASSRYIHVGPQLTSLIFSQASENLDNVGFSFGIIWDFLPVSPSDSVVMLCYNAIRNRKISPSALMNLPSNLILVEYGFQADYSFGPSIQELAQNGCGTSICVGTSAWSSLAGCPEASLCNIYHGTLSAVNNASLGLIVANWSGSCNFTPKVFALPGFLLASGLAWNHNTHWEYLQGSLANLLSTYLLKDKTGGVGQVILQLGCSESNLLRTGLNQPSNSVTNLPPAEGTTLYRFLTDPDNVNLEFLTVESLIKCIRSVKKCQATLFVDSKIKREDNPIFDELCLTMEMMLLGCKIGRSLLAAGINPRSNMGLVVVNLGINNLPPTIRTDIANKLLMLTEEYRRVWLLQNYPQGLETSLHMLTTVLQRFIPDATRLLTGRLVTPTNSNRGSTSSHKENGYPDSP